MGSDSYPCIFEDTFFALFCIASTHYMQFFSRCHRHTRGEGSRRRRTKPRQLLHSVLLAMSSSRSFFFFSRGFGSLHVTPRCSNGGEEGRGKRINGRVCFAHCRAGRGPALFSLSRLNLYSHIVPPVRQMVLSLFSSTLFVLIVAAGMR